jgi:hypothetical protein
MHCAHAHLTIRILSSISLHSLNYEYSLTRFTTSSSILRHRLENKGPILRFHLKLLDFLDLPRVECPFNTYAREGIAVVRLLKLKDREVTFDFRAAWKHYAEPAGKLL